MRCKPINDAPFNLKGANLGVNSQSFLIKDFNSTGKSRELIALAIISKRLPDEY